MPLPASAIGSSTAELHHTVDARWTMAHAAALGALDDVYLATDGEGGIVAHPMFPVCVEWPAMVAARALVDPAVLPREEYLRGVHASHDLVVHRLVRPGDALTTVATVESVEPRRPGAYEVLRITTVAADGEAVATTRAGSLFLGVDVTGDGRSTVADPLFPAIPLPAPAVIAGPRMLGRVIELPANLAHTYTEGSRIWNPIHTDRQVARDAGLPGPILHGTATLSMAVSEIVTAFAHGDPARVRRIGARFTGMVRVPSSIVVHVFAQLPVDATSPNTVLPFDVTDTGGRPVITAGFVVLGPH